MTAVLLLRIGGGIALFFFVFHGLFWKLFGWPESLRLLSPANRALPPVLNLNLMAVFLLFGVLFLVWPRELLATTPGRVLVAGVGICYLARAIEQPIFFDLASTRSIFVLALCLLAAALHFAAVLKA